MNLISHKIKNNSIFVKGETYNNELRLLLYSKPCNFRIKKFDSIAKSKSTLIKINIESPVFLTSKTVYEKITINNKTKSTFYEKEFSLIETEGLILIISSVNPYFIWIDLEIEEIKENDLLIDF